MAGYTCVECGERIHVSNSSRLERIKSKEINGVLCPSCVVNLKIIDFLDNKKNQ